MLACASLALAQTPPTITSVVDPYTGGTKLCPGGLATINGTGLGTNPPVTVGGKTAFTLSAPIVSNGTQMTIEIPTDAPLGAVSVIVTTVSSGPSAPYPITLTQYAPVLIASTIGNIVSPQHLANLSGLPVTTAIPARPGESILIDAIGLGPANPAVPTGTPAPNNAPLATQPSVSLAGSVLAGTAASLVGGQIGIYQIALTVPSNQAAGAYAVTISIGGSTSNSLSLAVGPNPSGPAIASVVDAVAANTALCPGDVAAINGANIGNSPQVTVGGKTAYNLSNPNGGTQMIVQIPVDAPLGATNLVLTLGTGQSATFSITLAAAAPVLINSVSPPVVSPVHQKSGAPVTAANPAVGGESIVVSAIGLGATNPVIPTGTPAPSGVTTATAPVVKLNGAVVSGPVTAVLAAGQLGEYQVTFTVPSTQPGGSAFLSIAIGTAVSNYFSLPVAAAPTGPAIASLQNNYSNLAPGLPNYGIAQGSIFDIFGVNLANTSTGLQSLPLSTTLQNVSVAVTVNGVTTHAILYYVTPGQLGAILPSATPVGDGTIVVTNNGQISPAAPIHVVQSAFGILTLNGAGYGPAAAFDVNDSYLGPTNALNPGDYFILWGTGVGPSAGDETIAQTPTDLISVPFSLEVGGVAAQVYYHGRSTYPGLDQVIGIVPAGVPTGCWVDVVTRSGNIVSNYATLPIAASGRTCSDPVLGVTASQLQSVLGLSSFTVGSLEFDNDASVASSESDQATAKFLRITPAAFSTAMLGPSIGSCFTVGFSAGNPPSDTVATTPLNAGPSIGVSGPGGSVQLAYSSGNGGYGGTIAGAGTNQAALLTQSGGTVTFSDGTGGSDVGAFTANATLASPVMSWTQYKTITTVSRTSGFTVSWTSADPNSYMQIVGSSISAGPSAVAAQFTCSVPSAAGQFAIPSSILLSMPASDTSGAAAGNSTLQVSQITLPQPFAATGLNFGFIKMVLQYAAPVLYQ